MLDWKYDNLVKNSAATIPTKKELEELFALLKTFDRARTVTPTGYTYFGQFIDHDLSFMDITDSRIPNGSTVKPVDVADLKQRRNASLNLDSIYGGGFDDSYVPFERLTGKFSLGSTDSYSDRDLPRRMDGIPLIADPRNDENLLVAQFQVLIMNFHNKVVDHYASRGYSGGSRLFTLAKNEVINVYNDLVLHDFAKTILPYQIYDAVICKKQGLLSKPDRENPTLVVEFPAAAFRLHGMVRESYFLNAETPVNLEDLFTATGKGSTSRGHEVFSLPDEFIVDWRFFFPIDETIQHSFAMQISPLVPIFRKPAERSDDNPHSRNEFIELNLARLSTLRGIQLGLPTGQQVKCYLEAKYGRLADALRLEAIESDILEQLSENNSIRHNTPLWLYIMMEARGLNDSAEYSGATLGVLGGWLVADSLVNAHLSTEINNCCNWKPENSIIYQDNPQLDIRNNFDNHITLQDLIIYTYGIE